jgi:hypothetical protein
MDALANKNIVCVARDGLLSISYTGIAFVRGVPTDEWMALKLLRLNEWDGGMRLGTESPVGTVGEVIELIRTSLERLPTNLSRFPNRVVAVGWQWKRRTGRIRPVLWDISGQDGGRTYSAQQVMARHRPRDSAFGVAPTQNMPIDHQRPLAAALDKATSVEAIEQLLIEANRETASTSTIIGPHCMSVVFAPSRGIFRAAYVPEGPTAIEAVYGAQLPVAYSPWILGTHLVMPPMIMTGGPFKAGLGPVELTLDAPPPSGDALAKSVQPSVSDPIKPSLYLGRQQRPGRRLWNPGP